MAPESIALCQLSPATIRNQKSLGGFIAAKYLPFCLMWKHRCLQPQEAVGLLPSLGKAILADASGNKACRTILGTMLFIALSSAVYKVPKKVGNFNFPFLSGISISSLKKNSNSITNLNTTIYLHH